MYSLATQLWRVHPLADARGSDPGRYPTYPHQTARARTARCRDASRPSRPSRP
jgi:hypothetical protein